MKTFTTITASLLLTVGLTFSAIANSQKVDENAIERETPRDQIREAIADKVFTDEEKQNIEDYFRKKRGEAKEDEEDGDAGKGNSEKKGKGKGKGKSGKGKSGDMPPGLAKKDELPPGLQMQLEKNGTLPPGLAKRNLPDDLNRSLPRRPDGIGRYIVNDDVILLEEKSGKILDIMRGVAALGLL